MADWFSGRFRIFSLPRKLGLLPRILLIVALGTLLFSGFFGYMGLDALNKSAENIMAERLALAQLAARRLDDGLEHLKREVQTAAQAPSLELEDGDLGPEQRLLRSIYPAWGPFAAGAFLTDAQGKVLAAEPSDAAPIGASFYDHASVRQALQTGVSSPASLGPAVGQNLRICLAAPVKSADGRVTGALGAILNMGPDSFMALVRDMRLGQTGYLQIVDAGGIVILSTVPIPAVSGRAAELHAARFAALVQERRAQVSTCHQCHYAPQGLVRERDILVFAPLTVAPWGLAVLQAEEEVLAPVRHLQWDLLLAGLSALALGLAGAALITQSVVRPLRALAAASRQMAAGDLSAAIAVAGPGEVRELSASFEAMRQKLKEALEELRRWNEELEERVRERTAQLERRTHELEAIYAVDRAASRRLGLDEVMEVALDKVLEVMGVEAGVIFLLEEPETLVLRAHRGLSPEFIDSVRRLRLGVGISGQAAAQRRPIAMDISQYPSPSLTPSIVAEGLRSLASAPLLAGDSVLGAININTRQERAFASDELALLASIGTQLGTTFESVRLAQQVERGKRVTEALYAVSAAVSQSLDLDEVMNDALARAMEVTEMDIGRIWRWDALRGELVAQVDRGLPEEFGQTLPSMKLGEHLAGHVAATREAVFVERYDEDPRAHPAFRDLGTLSAAFIPLAAKGKLLGLLTMGSRRRRAFTEEQTQMLLGLGSVLAVGMDNALLYGASEKAREGLTASLQQVERAKEEWQDTFDAVGDLISIQDRDYRIIRANRAFAAKFGLPPQEVVGRKCYELYHRTDRPPPGCPMAIALRTHRPASSELELPHLGGFFQVSAFPIANSDGEVHAVVQVARDITSLKQAEGKAKEEAAVSAALLTASEALTTLGAPEEIYRRLAEEVARLVGITCCSVLRYDPEAKTLALLARGASPPPPSQIPHEEAWDLFWPELLARRGPLAIEDAGQQSTPWQELLAKLNFSAALLVPIYLKGEMTAALAVGYPEPRGPFAPREIALAQGMARLASYALETLALRQEMGEVEAIRELDRVKTEFISSVSHELRSPLTPVLGYAELLVHDPGLGAVQREMANEVWREAQHMAALVDDLLDVSRIEAGRYELKLEPVRLGEFIPQLLAHFAPTSPGHRLEGEVPANLPPVRADPNRLEQVLTNLLNNAIRYSPQGGTITVKARRRGQEVLISIADQGIGIPQDKLGRIFEKFYRVEDETVQRVRGTGLGLTICRYLVEAHGGRIWAESVLGEGSTFYSTLPLARHRT